jgi:hypothetical protein
MKFFRDLLTQNDNKTYCIGRFGIFIGLITFVSLGFIHTVYNHTIDFSGFGLGIGSLLGAGGIYVGAQSATEKDGNANT